MEKLRLTGMHRLELPVLRCSRLSALTLLLQSGRSGVRGAGTSMDFACAEVGNQSSQARMDIAYLLLSFEPQVWRRVL